jgi:NADH-quinone oxidoreductase subunit N
VTLPGYVPAMLLGILPEILLLVLAGLILGLDLFFRPSQRKSLGWVTAAGLGLILALALAFNRPGSEPVQLFGGMLRHDWPGFIFTLVFLFAGAMAALLSIGLAEVDERGEYYALMVVALLGMTLMASASDLIMLYLAIESTSIPLYILAGFMRRDDRSAEAGMKYFLFGALTSTVMLYGFSLLYGFSGQTNLYALAASLSSSQVSPVVLLVVLALVLVGFSFKIAAVPFHFWTPDVYEGAPTPITGFISTASKAAGFAVLLRVLLAVFPEVAASWTAVLAGVSVATMTVGNILAISQKNIKRMLAYSSIAHAGYAMIGLVALSALGTASLVYYLAAYVFTNLAAFGVVVLFARTAGSDEIADYAGLSRRSPYLALALMVAILSLAGMPPLAGFMAKFLVFYAAVQSGLAWLAIVGVLNAIIGLYYYMIVLKVVYLYRSDDEATPIEVPRASALALGLCSVGIVLMGTLTAPWVSWALNAAGNLF